MRESVLAIVGNDGRLTASIEAALSVCSVGALPIFSFESFCQRLALQDTGIVILAPANAEEAEWAFRVVQGIRLCGLALMPIVVLPSAVAECDALRNLAPFLAGCWCWPEQKGTFIARMNGLSGPGSARGGDTQDAADLVCRLLSYTPSLQPLTAPVALAASHELPVLICGQQGTGRTYLARVIHECSPRRRRPFITVSCAELSPANLERELFGSARKDSLCSLDTINCARAVGGTLVLEDIDGLDDLHQAQLLHFVASGEAESTDGERSSPRPRILTVSGNLEEATAQGRFRRDLCDRLQGVTFWLPPLRDRQADVGPLTGLMTAAWCRQFSKDLLSIAPETVAALEAYPWPGNLRQLSTVVQQSVLATTGTVLLPEHLPTSIRRRVGCVSDVDPPIRVVNRASSYEDNERVLIQKALDRCGNNRTWAARALGISRVTLYKKMKRHRLLTPGRSTIV